MAVVILNWNGQQFLQQFLPSVISHSPGCRIIVADNASQDDSVAFLKTNYPEVEILIHPQNLGFCEGYNQALAQVQADYYVLLNSDVAVTPGWIDPLLRLMESDPRIAACQPKLRAYHQPGMLEYAGAGGGFIDYLGYPFCRGRIFETIEADQEQYNDILPVFWATGACMFIRARAYREAGGLEPGFFAHMEEIDLCWRLQHLGWKIMYCGHSEVYHVGGGTLPKSNARKTFLNFRNGFAMLYKNLPPEKVGRILPLRVLLDWVAALKFLVDGDRKSAAAVLKAHADLWRNRHYWRSRRQLIPAYQEPLPGIYPHSLVWDYFIRKKRYYSDLEIPDRAALPA